MNTNASPFSPPPSDPIGVTLNELLRKHAAQDRKTMDARPHRHRRRIRPLLNYMGGKSRVALQLIAEFPAHKTFVEVFGGSGIVTFAKPQSHNEIYNDRNKEVSNLFRIIRESPDALAGMIAAAPRDRQLFQLLETQDTSPMGDVERAFRTLYLASHGFLTGQDRKQYFAACRNSRQRWGSTELAAEIFLWSQRFNRVTIESLDFSALIDKYDSEQAFFYCDPPYPGLEKYYRTTFEPPDHERLATRLKSIKGKALVTLPDHPTVHYLYEGWTEIRSLPIRYSASGRNQIANELLIYVNYTPSSQTSTMADDIFDEQR